MREAVIVSYARTGLSQGRARRIQQYVQHGHARPRGRARRETFEVAPAEAEDVVSGCVAASGNVARGAALLAGLPVTTSGVTVNRACSSGLNAIANAARYVVDDGAQIVVGAGESTSITFQGGGGGGKEPKIVEMYKDYWMPMIDTADVVAARYNLSREYQDEYSLESQRRMAPRSRPASSRMRSSRWRRR